MPEAVASLADPAARILLAYLLGSVLGSLVIGRFAGGVDIRKLGSGNAGGTNALRTQGKRFAFGVMVIDIAKGWIAARWLPAAPLPFTAAGRAEFVAWLPELCGLAATLGHVVPVWAGFRGGKGAATLLGALAGIDPTLLVPVLVTWLLMVILAGFVGLATMTATAIVPVIVAMLRPSGREPLLAFGVAATLLIVFTHRSNLRRMRAGTEPRAKRLWLLGRAAR